MKKITFGIMTFALLLTACEKEKGKVTNNPDSSNYYVSAKVDGTAILIDSNSVELIALITDNGTGLQIGGKKLQSGNVEETIGLLLSAGVYHGEDTYYLNADGNSGSYGLAGNFWQTESGNPDTYGVLSVISTANGILQGTFRFYGKNVNDGTTKYISEGKFRLRITN